MKIKPQTIGFMRDSNDRNEDWRAPSTEFNLEAAGRAGRATVKVMCHGYWSDVITLYVERKIDWLRGDDDVTESPRWECAMSHSSGGRLTKANEASYPAPFYKAVADDLEAETYFGLMLMNTAVLGRAILAQAEVLEAAYQARRGELKAEAEAEKAAKVAKVAADAALGEARAAKLLREASEIGQYSAKKVVVYSRGADNPAWLEVSRKQNVTYRFIGSVISRAAALALLAESSERSHILS